jgi:RNA polymerase sigma-70 factor (ECF subfamily)
MRHTTPRTGHGPGTHPHHAGSSRLAEDVVQETFVQAYRGIQRFTDGRPFQPWFMRSVARAAVKAARRESRHLPLSWLGEDEFEGWLEDELTADQHMEVLELQARLAKAIQMLSPPMRAAVVLRYYLNLDERELGEVLGVAIRTVKWRLHMARRRLRRLLSDGRRG